MHALLNNDRDIRINQSTGRITSKTLEPIDQLLLILPKPAKPGVWRALPQGTRLREAAKKRPADAVPALSTRLHNKRQTRVLGGQISPSATAFEQLEFGRKLVAAATDEKAGRVGICVHGFAASDQEAICKNVLAAALAAGYRMPQYKDQQSPANIKSIGLLGVDQKLDLSRVVAEAHGNNLARWLTTMPPNKLDATSYADIIKTVAKKYGWQFKRFATRELEKLNAGAFLAVAQGNENDSAGIIRLRYRPAQKSASANLSLVGKGIIFDTGGTNLKPFQSMLDMHGDMQGSAVALGTLVTISELKLPIAVDCWLAITENRTGPDAYKSQDVVTAANGTTIQTIHTDAEGRMALADTLVLASRDTPGVIIDYATLTGSCVNAITNRYSGVFTNRAEWHPRLKRTGQLCGERVWPFPIGDEFLDSLKSDVADLKQCSAKNEGDHILAGSFLEKFVENDTPWIHVDLSASDNDGGLGHIPTKVTGFGVRYTMSLVLDEKIHETGN
ncbi:MAG: leucyl aminopeptidase family protein [Gammaproteobacteria bacterium]|nr:leucyl aminopeptidase family protein [Gammaproteobacteria bacterium]